MMKFLKKMRMETNKKHLKIDKKIMQKIVKKISKYSKKYKNS